MESWHLVNLHTLRCLEEGIQLPSYDATFFDLCCAGVSSTTHSHTIEGKNPALWKTIQIYRAGRSTTSLKEIEHQTGLPRMKQELRQQMVVNAEVMLREHFRRRLRAYVKVNYPKANANDVVRGCYHTEPTQLAEVREMRALLTPDGVSWCEEWIPWPDRITDKTKIEFYIRLLWKFQRVADDHIDTNPGKSIKGVRAFSLFPVATSYTASHIKINSATLAGLCSRVKKKDPETGDDCSITKWWGVDHIKIDPNAFGQEKWTVMRKAFDIDEFETLRPDTNVTKEAFRRMPVEEKYAHASHLFANQVTTDGYGASVLLFRPKNELDEAEKQLGRLVPEEYRPDVVIGLDPGMRSVCTAVREDLTQHKRVRRRSVRKKQQRKKSWIRRYGGPRHKNGRDIIEVHAKEYRHLAGFRKRRAWEEGLRKSNPEYEKVIIAMPSFKTSRYKVYLERLQYFWSHADFLLDFCWEKPFLKWKFFNKRHARIAVDALAARIVPDPSRQTCIAYGNWSRRDGIKGHASSPVKGLKQALAKRAKVVILDEFKTSKLCSTCHCELSPVSYLVEPDLDKRRKRRGRVISRSHSSERKETKCHAVLQCEEKKCESSYWNRDVNAAINIVNLLKYEIRHSTRIPAFARAQDRSS
ncbi:hypothetical protein Poli38472_006840 [Pythium oligandrum]|uniref:Cas12f1-like TNB domain-containing protein n=1 Tax=Pythium oligandrum TaxID=41045 RepID=A0A8K1C5J1_PYTOL|nr:hypothetical protein Poli38472_006840 [Pythium oligandrum]|eukprot:TMW56830.1 hypothetical protein Poli38472_006840 [Pythium oligandrum]